MFSLVVTSYHQYMARFILLLIWWQISKLKNIYAHQLLCQCDNWFCCHSDNRGLTLPLQTSLTVAVLASAGLFCFNYLAKQETYLLLFVWLNTIYTFYFTFTTGRNFWQMFCGLRKKNIFSTPAIGSHSREQNL